MPDPLPNFKSDSASQSLASQSNTTESSSRQLHQTPSSSVGESPLARPTLLRRSGLQSTQTSGSTITEDSNSVSLSPRQQPTPATHNQDTIIDGNRKKRPRVSKACVYCRKKKVKCDGNLPCSNCRENNDGDCVYPADQERKPKVSKVPKVPKTPKIPKIPRIVKAAKTDSPGSVKQSKAQAIDQLNLRMDRIEELLVGLTEEIRRGRTATYDDRHQSKSPVDNIDHRDRTNENFTRGEDGKDTMAHSSSPVTKNNKLGSHAITDIFSKSTLESLFQGLGPHNRTEVKDILHVGSIFNFYAHAFFDSICQPIKTVVRNRTDLIDNTFTDSTIPLELLNYLDDIYLVSYICESSHIRTLFDSYFKNNKKLYTKGLNSKSRSFTWSELMIMCLSIGLCISAVVDERNVDTLRKHSKHKSPIIESISDKELVELHTKCFFSAIFYYNRLVFACEGVETVQAMALFVIYLQSVISCVKSTYSPIALAVRYARDLGFNRIETYEGLSWHERHMRKRLWWFCQTYEVGSCYRYGRQIQERESGLRELIDGDKSTSIIVHSGIERLRALWNEAKISKDASNLYELSENKTLHRSAAYFLYQLTEIRLKSYEWIYSAASRNIKLSKLFTYIDEINKDMHALANMFQPPITICFHNDPRFFFKAKNKPSDRVLAFDSAHENILSMYMTYYLHLMTVNRTAIQNLEPTAENEPLIKRIGEYRHVSLESARTILHISKTLNLRTMPFSTFSWFLYAPFIAFCHLAGVHFAEPNTSEAETDLKLMIEISTQFFSYRTKVTPAHIQRNCIRQKLYDLVTRYMLRILINICNEEIKSKLFSRTKTLQKHLDLPQQFPEFYTTEGEIGINPSSSSRVFEMWFRSYNIVDIESELSGSGGTPAQSSNSSSSNNDNATNDSNRTSTSNSTSTSTSNSKNSKSGNSTSTESDTTRISKERSEKDSTKRKIDNILKHAISPSNSTKVRKEQEKTHVANDDPSGDRQLNFRIPQHASHSMPINRSHTPQSRIDERIYSSGYYPQTPSASHSHYNEGIHHPQQAHLMEGVTMASQPDGPNHMLDSLHRPMFRNRVQQHQLPDQMQQPFIHQQPHPSSTYMTTYAPRNSDASSITSHQYQYLTNAVPQLHQFEWGQNASEQQQSQQQQHNMAPALNPHDPHLVGMVPNMFASLNPGNDIGDHNQQSSMLTQLDDAFVNGSNMDEADGPPGSFEE
ncbi:hypothetical protein KGF57_003056 [Candida theae]|uniref:Zn(2)-C6 fungal-type domain-containing protein n=1 Tax=Candida theae TaxID=1198502 RepID=A0AAD5FYA0_9ASCO|nr:uncharacterized protein KGF57_003056 [Candida theae]KAI5957789.1 hypothetical protein KGF57_003056 [Candida theae]